ncbi:hypothetical protein G3A_00655 [Bacillus sp. 17376]|uniref:Uncharacterized protein n=1 Tax=Mesobacillus boroniphilus JCM 21738 TaxID=1294265 RepID=W4RVV1_9BACI|nr:hypothetical protein [Mesobacillus boroniphilus]ESU34524.1 hypothetical protein G3A_00655 [Bacillus sp. 17376]GAE48406.1 hypothetical protein JCM21738_5524 [Mesobacillus boroniphilus JCM 21738]
MRFQNQIIVEWKIRKYYDDFSFERHLERVINDTQSLNEGEALEIHQVVYVGEFQDEKVYLIILNIVPEKAY